MKHDRTPAIIAAIFLAVVIGGPWLPQWALFILTIAFAHGLVALGLMLLLRAGLVSFGQALYYCLGAYAAGALGRFRFDLANSLFQRQPLAGDLGFGKRRLNAAQLRDQRSARPLIERTAALAWSIGVQAGNSTCDQRVIISHFSSILQTRP